MCKAFSLQEVLKSTVVSTREVVGDKYTHIFPADMFQCHRVYILIEDQSYANREVPKDQVREAYQM